MMGEHHRRGFNTIDYRDIEKACKDKLIHRRFPTAAEAKGRIFSMDGRIHYQYAADGSLRRIGKKRAK